MAAKRNRRFNLYLPRKDYDALTAAAKGGTKASVIRKAIAVAIACHGKDMVLRDKATGEMERIILV